MWKCDQLCYIVTVSYAHTFQIQGMYDSFSEEDTFRLSFCSLSNAESLRCAVFQSSHEEFLLI